jgi:hypothetical protein
MRFKKVLLSLLLALLPALVLAQSPVGALAGSANPGDVVVVQDPKSGFSKEIKVDASGKYALRNLKNATYDVTIRHADGTKDPVRKVAVRIGTTTRVK